MLYVVAKPILESEAISASVGVILTYGYGRSHGLIVVALKISRIPCSVFHCNLLKYNNIFLSDLKCIPVGNHIQGAFMWETS